LPSAFCWLFTLYFGRFSIFFICFSFLDVWKRILSKPRFLSTVLKRIKVLTPVGYMFFYFLNLHFDILPSLLTYCRKCYLSLYYRWVHVNSCKLLRSQLCYSSTFKKYRLCSYHTIFCGIFTKLKKKAFGFEGAGLEGSFL
jgi:hypothetical protein